MSYEFLSEYDAFDYLDAMWNDGSENETLIEDHLFGVPVGDDTEQREGVFSPADEVSGALQRTWGELELLPCIEWGIPGDEHCTL